jgi:hypothetical protein
MRLGAVFLVFGSWEMVSRKPRQPWQEHCYFIALQRSNTVREGGNLVATQWGIGEMSLAQNRAARTKPHSRVVTKDRKMDQRAERGTAT